MKRSYMFNLDDFVRIGGRYEIVGVKERGRNKSTCVYRLFYRGESSLADVDLYRTGARMVLYRDDSDYTLFEKAQEERIASVEGNDFPMLLRTFLLAARIVLMLLLVIALPAYTVYAFVYPNGYGGPPLWMIPLSMVLGVMLFLAKPLIWAVMNMEHDDFAAIERSVTHENLK